ncbi:HlyD family efflux transporter periplasmic adaptor subunit [Rheinheimera baltica]|uniref:HlyD family efflux transporter periplasmic adaptor subunit n=1 Tax=Rheinheimera baltica TaxID=67576 RepID=A0ABT9I2Q1_9GAMM|nr:HlyD family efflux transporter periplasmic adaptor subunit [Rheinheimera baltica]MDP5137667.1 HlyD family efflux transporter periplasmic adaptor subunit [Rheinheimera baltica]
MSERSLFRPQALKQQGVKLDGNVVIAQPARVSLLLTILLFSVGVTLGFLSQASYHRKETVQGFLKPDRGLARVAPQRSGTIVELFVSDGEQVTIGQRLVRISADEYLAGGTQLGQQLQTSVTAQQNTLYQRLDEYQLLYKRQEEALKDRIANLQKQLQEIRTQQQLVQERQSLSEHQLNTLAALKQQGHVSELELNKQREQVLAVQQQYNTLQLSYQGVQGQLIDIQGLLAALPIEFEQQKAMLKSEMARLTQQHSELAARQEIVLTATVAGRVYNLHAELGSMAQAGKPLLTIMPEPSTLHAVLLVPTRAFGFIEPGQQTRLRFDAFPYQRFGVQTGRVVHQSTAILLPGDIALPVPVNEPVYQVNIELDSQTVAAYDNELPLQPGMLLNADIMLEQRSVLSWLFEPLLSLRGRL